MKQLSLCAALALLASLAWSQDAKGGGVTLIKGATVLTAVDGTIENGSVLIRDGKIAEVGRNIAAPAGAEVIDASGMYLTPGIIDCHSHIAISGGVNEGTLSVTSMVGVGDAIDPTDVNIYRDLAGGVTTANVLHGSANAIGGKNQVIKLRWGKDAEGLKFAGAPPGIKFALGENPKRSNSTGSTRYPATRMGVEDVIRDAFNRAKEYRRAWDDYNAKREKGVAALPPRRDLELESLVEVLQGKRLVHAHCYRSDEILMLIRLAEELGFKIATFQHVLEGYKVAKEIAAHGAGGSTFSDWWAYKIEAYDAIPYNAAVMTRKGVVVSINSDSAEEARHLNLEAAKCVRYGGLSEVEALRLVTLNPAKQLGIADRVGSIEKGKDADLVLYNHHPFSTAALPQKVWIDGTLTFDREKDRARLAELAALKKQLKDQDDRENRTSPRARRPDPEPEGSGAEPSGRGRQAFAPEPSESGASRRDRLVIAQDFSPGNGEGAVPSPVGTTHSSPLAAAFRASAAAQDPGPPWVIRNARIVPISGPVIENGTLVIEGGKIAAVGADVRVPARARIIEGRGLSVYPGLFDANTEMGLTEIGSIDATVDTNELGEFNPQLRAYDAIHPESEHLPVARVNGVTTTLSRPAGGILSGQAVVINLDGWTVEEMAVRKTAGQVVNLPRMATGGGRRNVGPDPTPQRTPAEARREYDRQVKRITDLFDAARHYRQAKEAAEKDPALPRVRHDEKLEALLPLLAREVPLLVPANSRLDIKNAVEFAEKQHLRLVILGGMEAGKVADLLKQKDVAVIYGSVESLPPAEDDPYDLPYATPAALAKAGVRFALTTGTTADVRNLPFEAGVAVGSGLSEEDALRAITLAPAQILGVADRLGSLERGKTANLLVVNGSPLDIRAEVKHVFINGRPIPLESKHTRLYQKYINRP